MSKTINMLTVP